jgi:hypothetical protein
MSILLHGDCLEEMKDLDDNSIDLIFCDLPYGQTSCKWDCKIDLEEFWIQIMRIKKLHTPIFFTTTTKFGVDLITSAPKKCYFRYDLVWAKSACCSFLLARKMPMRKHEMIYVFYEKLPLYDLSTHKHKFIKDPKNDEKVEKTIYGRMTKPRTRDKTYTPPLPTSIIKEKGGLYRSGILDDQHGKYTPPLPTSVIKEAGIKIISKEGATNNYSNQKVFGYEGKKGSESHYTPPLPTSIVKGLDEYEGDELCKYDVNKNTYGGGKPNRIKVPKDKKYHEAKYDPPLPTSVVKQVKENGLCKNYGVERVYYYDENGNKLDGKDGTNTKYDPPLPDSLLEIKSTRGKHSTEKPVALMEWVLKYYSKEGDVVLDPTMGSGSTGIACQNMNREFIGIEMDEDIFEVAFERIHGK